VEPSAAAVMAVAMTAVMTAVAGQTEHLRRRRPEATR
jgi:hypothetical protein